MHTDKEKLLDLVEKVSAYQGNSSVKLICSQKQYNSNKQFYDDFCNENHLKLEIDTDKFMEENKILIVKEE